MTNNKAIGILAIVVETAKGRCFVTDEAISDAYAMAISALQAQEEKTQLSAEGTTNLQPTCNNLEADTISRQAAIDGLEGHYIERINLNDWQSGWNAAIDWVKDVYLDELPSAQPEWNNHTVACMLAELFNDTCACNYNGIDEWLPEKCEVIDACPNPVGVACWEQYLKHRAERRTDGVDS